MIDPSEEIVVRISGQKVSFEFPWLTTQDEEKSFRDRLPPHDLSGIGTDSTKGRRTITLRLKGGATIGRQEVFAVLRDSGFLIDRNLTFR